MPSVSGPVAGPQNAESATLAARETIHRAQLGWNDAANRASTRRNNDGVDVDAAKLRGARHGTAPRTLVIGCGALARELVEVTSTLPGVDVACLSPDLHNRPDGIPGAVRARIHEARREGYERIFVAYADCGTGGMLDPVLAAEGVERLPGAHCYEFFAGSPTFAAMAADEPGTFWLTDFLARNFERLVIRGLGIDRHPELETVYFKNYTRVVYLSQTDDPDLLILARRAAERLGLAFEHRPTGIAGLAAPIVAFATRAASSNSHPLGVSNEFDAASRGFEPEIGTRMPKRVDPARAAGTDDMRRDQPVRYARGVGAPGSIRPNEDQS
jgi:hypothetical protein